MRWLRKVLPGDGRQASFSRERDIPTGGAQATMDVAIAACASELQRCDTLGRYPFVGKMAA